MTQYTQDERIRTWLLFVLGIAVVIKFAFASPNAIDPLLTTLVAGCLFGKAVINIWRGTDRHD